MYVFWCVMYVMIKVVMYNIMRACTLKNRTLKKRTCTIMQIHNATSANKEVNGR